ncbi:hypothetical protein AQULUS_01210 [Aquicella lusitana]|uniref:Uncharacterized protein n=1 Tax=Aquicella lusitana TaxID=254246 RepID=A0A370G8S2_9COXI|nr:hypothetical protein C8D86_12334 [Aquicella lusitana]VVC72411.1 hypothetical protein AQULUS_01210 [Aquicella lusitana]
MLDPVDKQRNNGASNLVHRTVVERSEGSPFVHREILRAKKRSQDDSIISLSFDANAMTDAVSSTNGLTPTAMTWRELAMTLESDQPNRM